MTNRMPKQEDIQGFELSLSSREDGTLEAIYIRVSDGEVAESKEIEQDVVIADYDKDGNLVGVEILSPVRIASLNMLVKNQRRTAFQRFVEESFPRSFVAHCS